VLAVVLDCRAKEAPAQAEVAQVQVVLGNFMVAVETAAAVVIPHSARPHQILELQPGHKVPFVLFGVLIERSLIH
jgi:hypothetical protein